MIRIEIVENASGIQKILVQGHAGQGPYGHDLCCAAVSAILFGGYNALQDDEKAYHYDIKEGYALLEVVGEVEEKEQIVLRTIEIQLESVRRSYPQNIEIQIKKE